MRELHVVATSEDGRHVVLATRKGAASGDFKVAIDERLNAAVRGDLPRPGEAAPAVVTPKEIQARLRAGESTEQIAASAGVPVAKIERYAGPVLSERERVIAQARAGVVSRSRLGESALPLGEAVDRQLADTTGVRLETVEWSARREEVGTWLVELSYVSQARRRSALWRYDVVRREVTATDAQSAALAHVEAGNRRSRTPDPVAAHAPASRTAARPAARRSTPTRTPKAPAARTIAARPVPPVRAAAPVPRSTAPAKAAQVASDKAAAAAAARVEAARAAAQEKAAKAVAAEAARKAQAEAARKAEAEVARKAKAAAARKAEAEVARKAKAEAEKKAKAEAERKARAAAEKKAKAAEARAAKAAKAAKAAEDAKAAEEKAAEAARVAAEEVPPGPPTLRVVGAEDAPAPPRRGPKEPPAAARTAPARVAGQRASVPGWADVLLSTAPVARSTDPEPDGD